MCRRHEEDKNVLKKVKKKKKVREGDQKKEGWVEEDDWRMKKNSK